MIINSKDNELIKHVKKLKEKKYRDEYDEYIIEGHKFLLEAIQEKANIKKIIISESYSVSDNYKDLCKKENEIQDMVVVSDRLFNDISGVVNNQGILAIIEKGNSAENEIDYSEDFFLILDNIQDPGNMGTIIRTADSLNMRQIIVSKGTVEVFNPKVVRSTMGAIFRVKVIEVKNIPDLIKTFENKSIKVYATDLSTDKTIYSVDFHKSAVIIGNEANGVEEEIKEVATDKIKIPMIGKAESLNAAVATGIILFEAYRDKLK